MLNHVKLCESCVESWPGHPAGSPRPVLLDGFSGGGGAARGYVNAGFEVWGIDLDPAMESDYLRSGAARFICADVLDVLDDAGFCRQFDFLHMSPPCQNYSRMSSCRPGLAATYPALIAPVRDKLEKIRRPYVIENVDRARREMVAPTMLCGTMFGKIAYRHRLFDPGGGIRITAPVPPQDRRGTRQCGWDHPVAAAKAGHWKPGMYVSVSGHERKEPVRLAMEIDWMTNREHVKEAIPPYFSEEVGRQVLAQLLTAMLSCGQRPGRK